MNLASGSSHGCWGILRTSFHLSEVYFAQLKWEHLYRMGLWERIRELPCREYLAQSLLRCLRGSELLPPLLLLLGMSG